MPIHSPGDATRQQWLMQIYGDREAASPPPAPHGVRIVFPAANGASVAAARKFYGALWSEVKMPSHDARLILPIEWNCYPLQDALARAGKAFDEVVALQHSITWDRAFGPGTEAGVEALKCLQQVCGELQVALDEVHTQLEEHIEGHVRGPRVDLRFAALALLKLLGAMVLALLAIGLVFTALIPPMSGPGLAAACWTALCAHALGLDALLTGVGETLRFRKSAQLPAALHLYPNHRETLRAWASGIRTVCADGLAAPSASAAGPRVASGPA